MRTDKQIKEDQISEIIFMIEEYTLRTGDEKQCLEINSEVCPKCRKFVNKLKREMRKL